MSAATVAELPHRPDPSAESRWSAWWLAWHAAYALDLGRAEGWRQCEREYRAAWQAWIGERPASRGTDLEAVARNRWHVCCLPCRRGGHQPGCRWCQDRTPATFGQPHDDDDAIPPAAPSGDEWVAGPACRALIGGAR
jgi:hypothetical protein